MKQWLVCVCLCLFSQALLANDGLKKAFAEGIKASVDVVKYERSQALKAVPKGYCVTVIGKDAPLDMWEEVKLESLALFLEMSPSLLAPKKATNNSKKVLCLSITEKKEDAVKALKKISKHYPKMGEYITKVEILPSGAMHRIIPGVGQYFRDRRDEIIALKQGRDAQKPLNGRLVLLSQKEKSKIFFDSGSTRVVGTALQNVLYVEHTVYRRKEK